MTGRWCPGVLALLLFPRLVAGQVMLGADLTIQNDFVWRGLTRSNPTSLQPSIIMGYKGRSIVVSAGVWASLEPFGPAAGDLSNVGTGGELLGEADAWVQWDWRLQKVVTLDMAAGWTAYTFHGRSALGGRGNAWNTSELHVKARLSQTHPLLAALNVPRKVPLTFELAVWKDLGPIGGIYGEAAVEADLPILPLGEPLSALLLRGALGVSYGQRHAPGIELGHYDGDGPTHLELTAGAMLSAPLGSVHLTVFPTGHLQVGLDPATLRRGSAAGDRSRVFVWWGLTVSALYPMRRAP